MKKLIYCALAFAAALFATSCQQENLEPVAQENTVTYTVEVPGVATKAIADGKNVDRLYYEVYMTNSKTLEDLSNATLLYKKDIAMVTSQEATSRANVTLNLVQNQNYTVLFWAQCDLENPVYDVTDLRNVTYKSNVLSNHEDYAAFYAVDCISDNTPRAKTVYLKRPFAQLNIGTLNTVDYSKDPYTVTMKQSKVTVKQVPTVFNVATSAVDGATDLTFTWESLELINDEQLVVNDKNYDYIAMNYMFAGENTTATVEYELEAVMTTQDKVEVSADLAKSVVNVPLKENYRTNIVGNLLTNATEYEVIVDADWAGDDLAPDPIYMAAANGGDVTLTEDVELTEPLAIKADMTLNLNGKTITGALTVAEGANVTIENGTISNTNKEVSGITTNGILTLNNVEIESARHAVRVESGKVVINGGTYKVAPISNSTLHALNVGDNNTKAEVVIKGGTFTGPKGTMADSGSAVNVRTGSKVVIEGGDFSGGKTKTVSCAGEMTITGGSFDQDPSTYVAEGYKVMEKGGKFYVVSEETDSIVSGKDDLQNALKDAVANGETDIVIDAEGAEIDLQWGLSTSNVPEGVTATIRNANVTGRSQWNYVDGTVIFEDCSFTAGLYSIHFDGGKGNVIFKNCDLVGWCPFAGTLNSVSFENCTLSGNGTYALIRSYANLTLKDCTINISNANLTDEWPDGIQVVSPATLTEENVVYVVSSDEDLAKVIPVPTPNKKKTILLAEGTYSKDINLTVEQFGEIEENIVFKAAEGTSPVIAGTVTLGYRNQGVGAEMWDANVTFDGITFDHAVAATHSFDIQDVKSLTLKNCTIVGDGEYGLTSARGNATGLSTIEGCTFVNAAMQLLGNFATGLVIDGCTFNESRVNVQAGNGVTIQNCTFNNTLKPVHVGDSFYCLRSNSTPITVKNCEINIDSELAEVATSQAKWYLLANRGTTDWTVENVAVTMTDAALQQTELQVVACTSTGLINTNNLTVNGFPYGISKNSEGVYVADPTVAGTLNWLKSNEPEIFLNGEVQYGSVLYTYANDGANVTMAAATEEAKTVRGLVGSSVTNATVSEGIKVIGDRTFRDAPNLNSVVLPSTLTELEQGAFQQCGLTSITIPGENVILGKQSIGYLPNLETITITAKKVTVGDYCARACTKLKSVYIYSDEITFAAGGSMYFTDCESNNTSGITFYVSSQAIADAVNAANPNGHAKGMQIKSIDGTVTYYSR